MSFTICTRSAELSCIQTCPLSMRMRCRPCRICQTSTTSYRFFSLGGSRPVAALRLPPDVVSTHVLSAARARASASAARASACRSASSRCAVTCGAALILRVLRAQRLVHHVPHGLLHVAECLAGEPQPLASLATLAACCKPRVLGSSPSQARCKTIETLQNARYSGLGYRRTDTQLVCEALILVIICRWSALCLAAADVDISAVRPRAVRLNAV